MSSVGREGEFLECLGIRTINITNDEQSVRLH